MDLSEHIRKLVGVAPENVPPCPAEQYEYTVTATVKVVAAEDTSDEEILALAAPKFKFAAPNEIEYGGVANQDEIDAWYARYGETHNEDGTPTGADDEDQEEDESLDEYEDDDLEF